MPITKNKLTDATGVSQAALDALERDADLLVCTECATQYPNSRADCPICQDPRQAVNPDGQQWTTAAKLAATHTNWIAPDRDDPRIKFIGVDGAFAINQSPILIEADSGAYIWDCAAILTPALIKYLTTLEKPLRAIAISHPHFFNTSLTWSRALNVPLYINASDKEWFMRAGSITADDKVVFWAGREKLGEGVTIVQCGGHFPGSSVLHWDRKNERPPPAGSGHGATKPPSSGLLLTSDTIMVQPTLMGFTWMWSYPNRVPMPPTDVLKVVAAIADLDYDAVSGAWLNSFVRQNAKRLMEESVDIYLDQTEWRRDAQGNLQPNLKTAGK